MMRWAAVLLVLAGAASAHAQWLKYPTPGVPRTADGRPNLEAPAPRLADGRPDFSGIWQLQPRPCSAGLQRRLPGRPRVPEFGRQPQGGLALPAVGQQAGGGAHRAIGARRSGRILQAQRRGPHSHLPAVQKVPAAARPVRDPVGARRHLPSDLPRRPAAARRSDADAQRLFDRPMGRRHAGGADRRIPRRHLARPQRQPDDRRGEDDRALPARELRPRGRGADHRRPQGLHPAVDGHPARSASSSTPSCWTTTAPRTRKTPRA